MAEHDAQLFDGTLLDNVTAAYPAGADPHPAMDAAAVDEVAATLPGGTAGRIGERGSALSGGQRQRAWIAMAVAQGTPVLLLDEPTTYLDLAHQIDVLDLVVDLNRREGRTIVMVLHDLNQACRYADHVIAMKKGSIVAEGAPADVITAATVEDVFGLRCQVTTDPVSRTPLVIPVGRHHTPDPDEPGRALA